MKAQAEYELDDPDVYKGAPVSLQLVGRRYEDEKVNESSLPGIIDYLINSTSHV